MPGLPRHANVLLLVLALSPSWAQAAKSPFQLGLECMHQQRYDEAVVYLQAALDAPRGQQRLVGKHLAFCYARTGQLDAACRIIEQLAKSGHMGRSLAEMEVRALRTFGQARARARAQRWADVVLLLTPLSQQTLSITVIQLNAAIELGHAHLALSQFGEAADAYARAEASGNQWAYNDDVLLRHLRCLITSQRPGDAVALIEKRAPKRLDPDAEELGRAVADACTAHADRALSHAQGLTLIGRHVVASRSLQAGLKRLTDQESMSTPADKNSDAVSTALSPHLHILSRLCHVQTGLAQLWLDEGRAALANRDTALASENFWRVWTECSHAKRKVWLAGKKAHNALYRAAQREVQEAMGEYLRMGDYAGGVVRFHAIANAYPFTAPGEQAAYLEAKCLRHTGKGKLAAARFERFLKRFPASFLTPMACYQLGRSHIQAGKPAAALKWYRQAIDTAPDAPNADLCAFLIAAHYWGKRDFDRCEAASKDMLRRYPNSPLARRAKLMAEYVNRRKKAGL